MLKFIMHLQCRPRSVRARYAFTTGKVHQRKLATQNVSRAGAIQQRAGGSGNVAALLTWAKAGIMT